MPPVQHRSRAAKVTLAALVGLGIFGGVVAGCGGSEPARVSQATMIHRADTVCADGLAEADRLRAKAKPGASGKAAAAEIDASIAVLQRQIDAFAGLRGPASTDVARERAIHELEIARDGLEALRNAAVDRGLTVNEAILANSAVVKRVNQASAKANDALGTLRFYTCIGVAAG